MQPILPARSKLTKPEKLNSGHLVADFTCGKDALDDWLKRRALKSHLAQDSRVYVVCNDAGKVVGYYAICGSVVARKEAISKIRRNAPDPVPMVLIGRLAVCQDMHNMGIGSALIRDAIFRTINASEHIGVKGILLHAMDDEAASFYAHIGFQPSPVDDKIMMIRLKDIAAELSNGPHSG